MVAIPNRYKNTLDDFIDSLDPEFLDWPRLIDKKLHNMPKTKNSLVGFLLENYLNEDVLDKSLWLLFQTKNSQVHQCCDIAHLSSKNRRAKHEKCRKRRKNYWKNNINPLVRKSSNTKVSIYYHIID